MHVKTIYKIAHGSDVNQYVNFNFTKLFYAWLQILRGDLHGHENQKKGNTYLIVWGISIHISAPYNFPYALFQALVYKPFPFQYICTYIYVRTCFSWPRRCVRVNVFI